VRGIPRARLDSEALIRDARTRLEYFDISSAQIRELERTGKARKTLTIRAPFTGIVTDKKVVEGQRIMAGMEMFRIPDVSTVWAIGKVYEHDLPYVKLGQEAFMTLSYVPGKTFRGRVTYVYPYLEAKTREVAIRMEFHNPGYELKPGMYATVTLINQLAPEATLVPDVAVINTGLRSVVFTMPEPGRFEPREVTIGVRAENNFLQVLSGLAPGETVVVSGQFLLDSESRLREAALKFVEPGKVDGATPIKAATERAEEGRMAHPHAAGEKLYYTCPMLGLLFAIGVVVVPNVAMSGETPPWLVAATTLAVAALFNPVRRRIQGWVDRRFNRSRYDAERVMDRFSGSLRDQVDPDQVVNGWVDVVEDTMEPSSLGLWVR
jgi:hypothetical protein